MFVACCLRLVARSLLFDVRCLLIVVRWSCSVACCRMCVVCGLIGLSFVLRRFSTLIFVRCLLLVVVCCCLLSVCLFVCRLWFVVCRFSFVFLVCSLLVVCGLLFVGSW